METSTTRRTSLHFKHHGQRQSSSSSSSSSSISIQRYFYKLIVLIPVILILRNFSDFHPSDYYSKNKIRKISTVSLINERDQVVATTTTTATLKNTNDNNNNVSNNLVVVNAVSRIEVLGTVLHNVKEHFSKIYKDDNNGKTYKWDCLIFLNVDETIIPNNNDYLKEIVDNNYCAIQRFPGLRWSHYLSFLQPTLLKDKYDHVAILLDDIYLPKKDINLLLLLQSIQKYKLSSISPSIHGAHQSSTQSKAAANTAISNCLADVELIEVFFQIFTINAWECFHKPLHYSSGGGAPYDVCYAKKCKDLGVNAVDYRQVGYHLEKSLDYLKEQNIDYLSSTLPKQSFNHTGGRGGCISGMACPTNVLTPDWNCHGIIVQAEINWFSPRAYPLECTDNHHHHAIKPVPKVIHTYTTNTNNNNDLDMWSKSWVDAGWEVKILSLNDAQKHALYRDTFNLIKRNKLIFLHTSNNPSIFTFLAMSIHGGYYADSTILPLHPTTKTTNYDNNNDGTTDIQLPNHGRFTTTKSIDNGNLMMVSSGTNDEWHRMYYVLMNNRKVLPSLTLEQLYRDKPYAFHYNSNQEKDNTSSNSIVNINDYKDYITDFNLCEKLKHTFGVYVPSNYVDMNMSSKEQQLSFVQSWYDTYKERCW